LIDIFQECFEYNQTASTEQDDDDDASILYTGQKRLPKGHYFDNHIACSEGNSWSIMDYCSYLHVQTAVVYSILQAYKLQTVFTRTL